MMSGKPMPSMGSQSSAPSSDMMSDQDSDETDKDSMSSKLLAMQNILDNLSDIVGDDMKPYIDQAKESLHMQHEQAEGDQMGVENEQEHEMNEDGMPKSGMDITVDMGGKPSMSEEPEDDDENMPKKGFLAILAKRMKAK